MITDRQLAKAVFQIIDELGYTQRCIAKKMRTQESRISDVKSGRKMIGLHFLLDFSRAVRMPLSTIFMIAENEK